MTTPRTVTIDASALAAIALAANGAYPNEGCGALLGELDGGTPRVTLTLPIPNSEAGTPRVRFAVAPRDYLAVECEADRLGARLLGFWHSHPDHPARPSGTDRAYAWEGLLTVIVSVRSGESAEIGAFEILGPEEPFTALEIQESGSLSLVTRLSSNALV